MYRIKANAIDEMIIFSQSINESRRKWIRGPRCQTSSLYSVARARRTTLQCSSGPRWVYFPVQSLNLGNTPFHEDNMPSFHQEFEI